MRHLERRVLDAATEIRGQARSPVFIICDHASKRIPPEYGDLGLEPGHREDHIAWDIGAAEVARVLSAELDAPAVLGGISRLVVDLNRRPEAPDVIPGVTHGVRVPGNEMLAADDRASRFRRFYHPYHEAVDRLLAMGDAAVIVSIHSFSHALDRAARDFDVGLLFDEFESLATAFAQQLTLAGLRVRLNEPYSGRAQVVSSAQTHGRRYGLPNYEIEISQRLVESPAQATAFGHRLVPVVAWLGEAAPSHIAAGPG
jgi:predicted N-formylglutamate amidohydrolase